MNIEYINYICSTYLSTDIKYWDYKPRNYPMGVYFMRASSSWEKNKVAYIPCVYKNKVVKLRTYIWETNTK